MQWKKTMTKEEIIELAIQAGIKHRSDEFYSEFCDGVYFDDLITFAKLVRADYGKLHASLWLKRIDDAVKKEREECAKTAENISSYDRDEPEVSIAKAIRARGQNAEKNL